MKQKGFTLIELLVSMGIIAVLTGMAVFNFNQSRMRARDVQRKSDLSQLTKAMELHKNDLGYYPDLTESTSGPDKLNAFQKPLIDNEYIKTNFVDPKGSEWQNYYYNNTDGENKRYSLMACLENKADATRATVEQCQEFPNFQAPETPCVCGGTSFTGVMYIVSNP